MPKKNKRRKRNRGANGSNYWGTELTGEFFGNFLGQLAASGVEHFAKRAQEKPGDHRERDVSAKLLRVLCEQGPKSIPDLIESTGAGLSDLLHSLQSVRDFRLVEFVGEGEMVQLTRAGSQTVTVLQKDGMRREAARLLEA